MNGPRRFAVLEVGGSHVTSAWVEREPQWHGVVAARLKLDPAAPAEAIVGKLLLAGRALGAPPESRWAVALPGPFDYEHGTALFTGVGKFDSLYGADLRAGLSAGLGVPAAAVHFVNDANAFALGAWVAGRPRRLVGLTIGTGIGSGFVDAGVCVVDGDEVPPAGELYRTLWRGLPIEDTVSHRAIVAAYAASSGSAVEGVREVVDRSRQGDVGAAAVLSAAFSSLGAALAPWLDTFGPDQLVVGGSISHAWDTVGPAFAQGLRGTAVRRPPDPHVVADTEQVALVGAAWSAHLSS